MRRGLRAHPLVEDLVSEPVEGAAPGRILLATTVDVSLDLMRGFPAYLSEQGWDVHVVSAGGPRLNTLGQHAGITVHSLPMERRPHPIADLKSLCRWISLIRRIRPDLVAVGTPKAGLLSMVASAAVGVRRRVYILRGLRLETATGVGRALLFAAEWLAMACSHKVLAVSSSLRNRIVDMRLCRRRKVIVLGSGSSNGVDLDAHSASRAGLPCAWMMEEGLPVVGFVGRIVADKGLFDLADALCVMREIGTMCQLLVVGQFDDEDGDRIMHALVDAGQPLIKCGYLPDATAAYKAMDVICLPSRREGFPNVILEAAAAGRPAVVSAATGNVDAVLDGVTGYVVPVGDSDALAAALADLIADEALRRQMGKAARTRVMREFQRSHVWERSDAFFRSQMDRSTPLRES